MSELDQATLETVGEFRRKVLEMKRMDGMSYEDLSVLCEVKRHTISNFINGDDSKLSTVLKISLATGISIQ